MPCGRCGDANVAYYRRYSGERLCSSCFIETFERRVYKTIAKYKLLREDDRILIGVSGGKDSLALLHVLNKIESRFPRASIVAVTIDEGIPGYREESLEIAVSYCSKLGVEHHIFSFNELFGITMNEARLSGLLDTKNLKPCSLCGVFRRKALNIAARELGATVIATAHTLDDIVQTYFMNILRGDVPKRLIGVRNDVEGIVPRVAPFRLTPESEVVFYAYLCGIPFQTTPCPNAPESQRDIIRRFLSEFEEQYSGSLYTAISTIENELLKNIIRGEEGAHICKICGEPSSRTICRSCELAESVKALKTP